MYFLYVTQKNQVHDSSLNDEVVVFSWFAYNHI